jgi:hypothetical protein
MKINGVDLDNIYQPKETGKGLSTNDYTTNEKQMVANAQPKINISEGNIVIGGTSDTLVDSGINIRMTLI